MSLSLLSMLGGVALAHHPHDPVNLFDLSSDFSNDQTAFGSRFPAQNWRPIELVTSFDGAFTWQGLPSGLTNASAMTDFQLSPDFANDGVGLITTNPTGAWLTTDGGYTWMPTALTDAGLDLGGVAEVGGNPVLIAHETDGPLWRSDDLGVTWDSTIVPDNFLALDVFENYVVFGNHKTVFTSTDGGMTFDDGVELDFLIADVAIGPQGTTLAGTANGMYLSVAGSPYERMPLSGAFLTVAVAPSWPSLPVLMGAKEIQGTWVSDNGGADWALSPPPLTPSDQTLVHFYDYRFARDFETSGAVFCNMWEGLIYSNDYGRTWSESDTRPPGMVTAIAMSPNFGDDEQVVIGSYDAGSWYSPDGGISWNVVNAGLTKSSTYDVSWRQDADGPLVMMGMRAHLAWGRSPFEMWDYGELPTEGYTSRVALSPNFEEDGVALAGTRVDGVLRTADGGKSWAFVTSKLNAITSIAWGDDGVVLFGVKDGTLYRSDDNGATFADVPAFPFEVEPVLVAAGQDGFLIGGGRGLYTTDGDALDLVAVPDLSTTVHQVAASTEGTWFAAMRGGGLYRSDDRVTFTEIGSDLSAMGQPHELAVSPTFATDDTMMAAIDERLFRSQTRGDTWEEITPTPVRYEEDAQSVILVGPDRGQFDPLISVNAQRVMPVGTHVSLEFQGVQAAWIGSNGGGIAEVEIDGKVVATVDTEMKGSPKDQTFQLELFKSELLPLGRHSIKVTSIEGEVAFDGFDVYPVEARVPGETVIDTGDANTGDTGLDYTSETDVDDGKGCGCDNTPAPVGGVLALGLVGLIRRRPGSSS